MRVSTIFASFTAGVSVRLASATTFNGGGKVLSDRLQAVFDCVPREYIVADVGGGHGLLSCALALDHSKFVYCIDRSKSECKIASSTVQKLGLDNKVKVVVSSGVEWLVDSGTYIHAQYNIHIYIHA